MRGAFVVNKYYTDGGIEYAFDRLRSEFAVRGVDLNVMPCPTCYLSADGKPIVSDDFLKFDFVVFWDKDVAAASVLERTGKRVFNSSEAIEVCDDKAKTALKLIDCGVGLPETLFAPVVYDINDSSDTKFISEVETALNYPVVVKENKGSQGRQVYLATNRDELTELRKKLLHIPHIYQRYVSDERGVDIRVYTVGGKAIAACKRKNTTSFKSNVHMGGTAVDFRLSDKLKAQAERIAEILQLDYGSIDFLTESGVFAEANSNAYFTAIEKLGYNIAGAYAEYVIKALEGERR